MSGWWHGRSGRERILLGIMFALMAAVFAWLAVFRPLWAAQAAAEDRYAEAIKTVGDTRAQVATVKTLSAQKPQPLGLTLPEFLRVSASQAGFTNAMVDAAGNGRARLSVPSARAAALLAWLDRLEGRGIFVERATIRTSSDGTVALDATIASRAE